MRRELLNLFRKKRPQPPKYSLDGVELHIMNIPGAIEIIDGFPRIHWSKVREAAKVYRDHPAIDQIWTELAAQWLGIVRKHLGDGYEMFESDHLLVLSAQPTGAVGRLAELGDGAFDRLEKLLGRTAKERGRGKHAVVMLETQSAYYDYISHFYPGSDRPYGMSSGIHISRGYRHTAIFGGSDSRHRTLVHELAHDMVSHFPLPLWLNEGFAQSAEDLVPGFRPPLIDRKTIRLHRRYWSWFGMDQFWDGRAFKGISAQRLSYQLAEILFRNLSNHKVFCNRLGEFLATADRKDAGVVACAKCFDCSLGDLVAEVLGPGSWDPTTRPDEQSLDGPANDAPP
jgi:hypothetical protein